MAECISYASKLKWGIRCTESTDFQLYVGKGCRGSKLSTEFSSEIAKRVSKLIREIRPNKTGRFWYNDKNATIVVVNGNEQDGFVYYTGNLEKGTYRKFKPETTFNWYAVEYGGD
jgi:methylaspartate ammonia-lyase